MEWIENHGSNWITQATREEPFGVVARLIPRGYASYCRLLHPIYEDPGIADRTRTWHQAEGGWPWAGMSDALLERVPAQVRKGAVLKIASVTIPPDAARIRWAEVAQRYGQTLGPETNYDVMMERAGFRSWPRYLLGPSDGDLGLDHSGRLARILQQFVGMERVWFQWFAFHTAAALGGRLHARLDELPSALALERIWTSPLYWWPDDRSWCVVSDMDSVFTVVGGSRELIESVIAEGEFETQETSPDHSF